jgi:hypothetical protein
MRLIMAHLILRFSVQGDQLTLEAFGLCLRSSTLYDSDERMLTANSWPLYAAKVLRRAKCQQLTSLIIILYLGHCFMLRSVLSEGSMKIA